MKRILVLHISEFGGHKRASMNIEEALIAANGEVDVLNINGMGHIYPRAEKIVDFIYVMTIKRFPHLWGRLYDRKAVVNRAAPLKRFATQIGFRKFAKIIDDFRPDAVLATQAFPCTLAADFKVAYKRDFPLFAVVTDYHPHGFWIHPCVNSYIVACQKAKDTLMSEGISPDKIKILGIPISMRFLETHKKENVCQEFGFRPDLPSILIMGGGSGFGPIKDIVIELDKVDCPFQLIVVCGKNKELYEWLNRRKETFSKDLFVYGYIEFVDKLMDFSDIIITKAGGITISESLSKALAIMIINPIPGQEERNVEYLQSRNAVLTADKVSEVPQLVKFLLTTKGELNCFKKAALSNSTKDSAVKIADFVLSYLN